MVFFTIAMPMVMIVESCTYNIYNLLSAHNKWKRIIKTQTGNQTKRTKAREKREQTESNRRRKKQNEIKR